MKTLTLPGFLIAMAISISTALGAPPPLSAAPRIGGKAALQALPADFAHQVVRLSADYGRPNPKRWYVLARNPRKPGFILRDPLYSITILGGEISDIRRSLDVRQVLNRRNFISPAKLRVDSADAFDIARDALGRAGHKMRSASYQLTQRGPAADPIWEIWAYGKYDRYLGLVRVSARSGAVISSRKSLLSYL
jgi:hypothetical protein